MRTGVDTEGSNGTLIVKPVSRKKAISVCTAKSVASIALRQKSITSSPRLRGE